HERAFTDPRRAPDQHDRTRHEAAPQHAVELAAPGLDPLDRERLDLGKGDGLLRARSCRSLGATVPSPNPIATLNGERLFVDSVPLATARAATHPLRAFVATCRADEGDRCSSHSRLTLRLAADEIKRL